MATRNSKASGFSTSGQARAEQAAHLAGIAAAFGRGVELGPQVLALQQSLLSGVARSQRREAERLSALHEQDDPRITSATERATRVEEVHADLAEHAQVAGHIVETFQRGGMFHGYVTDPDGAPAVSHTVRLELADASGQKLVRHGDGKTDAAGYFRIDLRGTRQRPKYGGGGLRRWAERLAQAAPIGGGAAEEDAEQTPSDAAAPAAGPAASGTTGAGTTAITSRVEVLDPGGRAVFEDPQPPTFDQIDSEFRYYVLTDKGTMHPGRTVKKR